MAFSVERVLASARQNSLQPIRTTNFGESSRGSLCRTRLMQEQGIRRALARGPTLLNTYASGTCLTERASPYFPIGYPQHNFWRALKSALSSLLNTQLSIPINMFCVDEVQLNPAMILPASVCKYIYSLYGKLFETVTAKKSDQAALK